MALRGSEGLVRCSVPVPVLGVGGHLAAYLLVVVLVCDLVGAKEPGVVKVRTPPWAEMPGCFQHEVVSHDFPWSPRFFWPPQIFVFVVAFLHPEA